MMPTAEQLKQEGNRHFQTGDYVGAEALYSKAIVADPREPTLYTNRAMARLKLSLWDLVIADCNDCLAHSPADNMKAHYYLAQAHLERRDYDDALSHALNAHRLCNDKSLEAVTALVLRARKERWEDKEKKRRREGQELENEVLEMMARERDAALKDEAGDDAARREIESEWSTKMETMCRIFEKARNKEDQRRKVPTWAIDDITFGYMVDPVMTKSGKSYERSSIMEHLRRQHNDPITRETLHPEDLRPNLNLKQACEEFLEENGWAVDW